jgi:serine/threonine-protein kinase RsbW
MQFPDTAGTTGRPAPPPRPVAARSELDRLRATCRSQALTIDALGAAVSALRAGAEGLKADNAELRAECARLGSARRGRGRARFHADATPVVRLPCDARAPGAARIVVAQSLRDRVAADVLERAQLLVTELVTNSVRHSGARPEDAVIVRVSLGRTTVRLEVEDCGRGGVIAPRPPDLDGGGGFGLQLVQTLSERWGLERAAHGATIVWAQLPRTALTAPADSPRARDTGRAPASLTPINQRAGGRRAAPAEGQP